VAFVDLPPPNELIGVIAALLENLGQEARTESLAVIVAGSGALAADVRREVVSRIEGATVLSPSDAKGLEFFRGILVDLTGETDEPHRVTRARYQVLSGLYVGATRFRDRLIVVAPPASPARGNRTSGHD